MKLYSKITWLFWGIGTLVLAGCAVPTAKPLAPFAAEDLNPKVRAGELAQKSDNMLVVVDSSGSMLDKYKGQEKLDLARNFVERLNQTIPDIRLKAGLRKLGGNWSPYFGSTDLIYGVSDFHKPGMKTAIEGVTTAAGETPLGRAIRDGGNDLKATRGQISAIIVSDGRGTVGDAASEAKKLKARYGDRLCLYPVIIGDDPMGYKEMEQIARDGQCGFAVKEENTRTSAAMANFVEGAFFTKVAPRVAQAPKPVETPKPMETAKAMEPPKPMDSDGDGVLDTADRCPGTPRGAQVDTDGCWVIKNVQFDFDKFNIKPTFESELDKVADVLKQNPSLKVKVQGYTDSIGTPKYNMSLSEKRAKSVADYLAGKGISKERLETEAFGLTKPIATNKTPAGRAENRRVQFNPLEK